MFHRKDKAAPSCQPPGNPGNHLGKVPDIVKGQGAEDNVKGFLREIQILHGCTPIIYPRPAVPPPGSFQHFFGNVRTQHPGRSVFLCILAVPLPGKVRQDFFQLRPLPGPFQPLLGTKHLAVLFKKHRVVVFVFFHMFVLPDKSHFLC